MVLWLGLKNASMDENARKGDYLIDEHGVTWEHDGEDWERYSG
jgi:hypothetical protein